MRYVAVYGIYNNGHQLAEYGPSSVRPLARFILLYLMNTLFRAGVCPHSAYFQLVTYSTIKASEVNSLGRQLSFLNVVAVFQTQTMESTLLPVCYWSSISFGADNAFMYSMILLSCFPRPSKTFPTQF